MRADGDLDPVLGLECLRLPALMLGVTRSHVAQTLELVGLAPAESRRRM